MMHQFWAFCMMFVWAGDMRSTCILLLNKLFGCARFLYTNKDITHRIFSINNIRQRNPEFLVVRFPFAWHHCSFEFNAHKSLTHDKIYRYCIFFSERRRKKVKNKTYFFYVVVFTMGWVIVADEMFIKT